MRMKPGRYGREPRREVGEPEGPAVQHRGPHHEPDGEGGEDQSELAQLALADALPVRTHIGGGDSHDPGLAERPQRRAASVSSGVGVELSCVAGAKSAGAASVSLGAALQQPTAVPPVPVTCSCLHPRPRRPDLHPARRGLWRNYTTLRVRSNPLTQRGINSLPIEAWRCSNRAGSLTEVPGTHLTFRTCLTPVLGGSGPSTVAHMGPASCLRPGRSSRRDARRSEGPVQGGPGLGGVDDLVDESPLGRHPGGEELGVVALLEDPALVLVGVAVEDLDRARRPHDGDLAPRARPGRRRCRCPWSP